MVDRTESVTNFPEQYTVDANGRILRATVTGQKFVTLEDYNKLRDELEAAWQYIEMGYDIKSREYFEAEAPTNGFKWPLAQAIHHIWKRDPKVLAFQAGQQL